MARRALFVGIDVYEQMTHLQGCVADALALEQVIAHHSNHTPNYACKRLVSDEQRVSRHLLLDTLKDLFDTRDEILFAFAGHGTLMPSGVYLATQDGSPALPGIALHDLLRMANSSLAKEILIILDCCHAGAFGEPLPLAQEMEMHLRDGVTLLAASLPLQSAVEIEGHGMFTRLVIGALQGGGKDVRGRVTSASIYSYVDQALGPWEQRPVYKSNASRLMPVRMCTPDVSGPDLQRLPELFSAPDAVYRLDPTYEFSRPEAIREHVAIFGIFKRYRDARLLKTTLDPDLYFAALHRTDVVLTPLGQYYWQLAKKGLLESDPAFPEQRRYPMPDAEAVARLFHETYERLAPSFDYQTRRETAVPWDQVQERNKRLMVAVAAEVIAMLFPPEETISAVLPTPVEQPNDAEQ